MATTTNKQSAAQRRPGENGFKYRQQFGLVIVCKDEQEQQQRFALLKAQGLTPKVVCV